MRALRIAIAGFVHETNSFSTLPTAYEDFERCSFTKGILRGDGLRKFLEAAPSASGGFFRKAVARGHRASPLLYAFAEPSGTVQDAAFDAIVADITGQLSDGGPWDAVFLELHGAMITQSYDEAEAEIVARVRKVVGPDVPVVASFDLHGNLTATTLAALEAASAFRTYPHIDMALTGERALDLIERRVHAEPFALAHRAIPFLMPLNRQSHLEEPCRSLYAALDRIERADAEVVSLNLMLGFPLGDAPNAGPCVFAYGRTQAAADRAAELLLNEVLQREHQFVTRLNTAEEAAQAALAWTGDKPLLIADVQDNAGGGASSDTVEIIEALIRQQVPDAIVGLMHDPESVRKAHEHGVGAMVTLALGGKSSPQQQPLSGDFLIEAVSNAPFELTGPIAKGLRMDLGASALVRHQGVRIVLTTGRTQCMDSGYFRHFGLDPVRHRVIVVKSANHYRADFQPFVGAILEAESDGACVMDPAKIPYRKLRAAIRRAARVA